MRHTAPKHLHAKTLVLLNDIGVPVTTQFYVYGYSGNELFVRSIPKGTKSRLSMSEFDTLQQSNRLQVK